MPTSITFSVNKSKGFTLISLLHRWQRSCQGFTLIELLVVIAIIAILSVVGVVVFRGVTSGARDAARKADLNAISKAYEAKYSSSGLYQALATADFASGNYPTPPEGNSGGNGGNYFNVIANNGSGFKTCAALEVNPVRVCNTSSVGCFCVSSTQGSIPADTPPSGLTGTNSGFGLGSSICDPALAVGLVGYWKMDEGTGNTTGDSSGNGNNGILINGPRWDSGKSGSAISYDGVDDYVNYPEIAFGTGTLGNLAVEAWVKLSSSSDMSIVSDTNTDGTFTSKWGYELFIEGGKAKFFAGNQQSINTGAVGTTTLATGVWYHIAGVMENQVLKVYINGKQEGSTPSVNKIWDSWSNSRIGMRSPDNQWTNLLYFSGLIDDVRVYNRALSPNEVSALYSGGNGCIP